MYKEAPWNLMGDGYIILYKFKKDFIKNNLYTQDFLKDNVSGGLGCIMIVDYKTSDVGPYRELLFIPGKFNFKGKKLNTISKIYVSTEDSVVNGIRNWGIPKELCSVHIEKEKDIESFLFSKDGEEIIKISFKNNNFKFPVNTKLLPFPLVQKYDNKFYYTNFYGHGVGSFSKIKEININNKYFPDIKYFKPLAVIRVSNFNIVFPKSKVEGDAK